jgi:hypothetical protein
MPLPVQVKVYGELCPPVTVAEIVMHCPEQIVVLEAAMETL